MSWREVTAVSERLSLCRLAIDKQVSVAALARGAGVSRKTAYKWIARYAEMGEQGVFDISRRPKRSPSCVSDKIAELVVSLHGEYPAWGPRKLHTLLSRRMGCAPISVSTVARILNRRGLTAKSAEEAVEELVGRFERSQPNELWQIDFTSPIRLDNGSKIYPVPILDDHSRYCVALTAMPDTSGKSALHTLVTAAKAYGLPDEVLSDHGGAFGSAPTFISAFTAYLWAVDVRHVQGRYAHPQTQGKLERFNRTLKRECISRHGYASMDDWNRCFDEYRSVYNQIRPHDSLDGRVPADVYRLSEKKFAEPDKSYKPDGDFLHRRVALDGRISLLQHRFDVGNGLAGWTVSASHDEGGIWNVYFYGRIIRQVELAGRIRPSG